MVTDTFQNFARALGYARIGIEERAALTRTLLDDPIIAPALSDRSAAEKLILEHGLLSAEELSGLKE